MSPLTLHESPKDAADIIRHAEIYACIKDDGSPPAEEFTIPDDCISVVVYIEEPPDIDKPISCFVLHSINFATYECHVQVLPEHRDRSSEIGQAVIEWTRQNTQAKKLIAWIPFDYENVKNFALEMGFKVEGVSEDSIMKQGKLISQWLLGLKLWDS